MDETENHELLFRIRTDNYWSIGDDLDKAEKLNMSYKYTNSYSSTRDGDVAAAALEAMEAGISLDALLKKNKTVHLWWNQHLSDRKDKLLKEALAKERQAKLAEKKRLEDEARARAASKLTPEELEAFGLSNIKKVKSR